MGESLPGKELLFFVAWQFYVDLKLFACLGLS